jgi:hypothetical protein
MIKLIGWATALTLSALLLWQSAVPDSLLPHVVNALLLLLIGVLAGLRIATDSSAAYIQDLQRLNKVMANQQRDLEEANWTLITRANAETITGSENS